MSSRRRHNVINVVSVDGVSVNGVQNIRAAVYQHFSSHIKSLREERSRLEGSQFRKLSCAKAGTLTRPFSLEEVKQAVWECDSFKSPRPDGISFDFIKHFWDLVKDDFMRFLVVSS